MKSATQCLKDREIQALLSGAASHVESKIWEEHVSACEHCRAALAGSIGDEDWWHEAEQSLMRLPKPESQDSIDNEGETIDELLKLLGPTDDPRMLGRIGFYEVLGVLGRGGMGVVFKAFDASLNRFVAIKMLLPQLAASGAARKRFAREAQAIAAVVDDHVMAIHCVDEWQGVPYFVMTYSRGVSLQKRLGDYGTLEVREILRIGMQAAKGLAAAHAQGIVHRDIKPANIFLDQNVQRVQLMDFGLARAVDDASLTRSGTLAGTPQYMSPEQARSEAIDHRSDLFSLGSVLYAMCTGHSPFRSESSYSVLRLIIEKEPRPIREINSDIPEWLCAIIGKLMSKSPEDRYVSAMDLAKILEQCLAHVQDPIQISLPLGLEELKSQANSKKSVESQLDRWFLIMNDKRVVSLISLVLLLMAMLVPWPIAAIGSHDSAIAFAGLAAALSLGLALLSRSEYFSRIVLWSLGAATVIKIVGLGISMLIFMLRDSNVNDTQQGSEPPSISNVSEAIPPSTNSLNAVKLSNSASGFRIAGKCVDENGTHLENVTVELYRNAEATMSLKTLTTKADGAFDFGTFTDPELSVANEENYVIVSHLNGKAFGYVAPLGYSTNPEALEIVLGVPAKLKGTITGPDGIPVKNARVRKAGTPWIAGVTGATTDDTGQYVLEGMPTLEHPGSVRKAVAGAPHQFEMIPKSTQFLVVDHPDFGMFQPPYAECPAAVDVSLDLPSRLSGRVVDGNGKPIGGVKVTARPSRNPAHREAASRSLRRGYSYDLSETDIDGKYSLELQYRGPLEIEFVGSNHLAKTVSDVFAVSGETSNVPDVAAVEPAMIVGRIRDADTDNTVACPSGVRLRVYAMGDGALRSVVVQPDGTYRLPVLPGTTFVYFSLASESLRELTKTWDVLEHPNPLTAKNFPVEAGGEAQVEVNFPVRMNKEKLGNNLRELQGEWEIQSGAYVAGGNARVQLTADRLLDGDRRPLRFTIRGNQWIGNSMYFCSALEPEIGLTLCDGIAELALDAHRSVQSMMLTRFEGGNKRVHRCLYRLNGDNLELVCNSTVTEVSLPQAFESPHESFVLNARRINYMNASPVDFEGNTDKD